ncbi:MAG: type I-E CRISPR-associated endonuclease Cas1e [Pseudomonadota bacterium]|nr:type I-E CRISPR-associated endonuclease Cas1e [Pseudomonadota bacterium]
MLKGRLGLETARVPHSDRHGLLTISRGELYVNDGTLRFKTGGGTLPSGDYAIPFQALSCILAGPGTSVTHDALRLLARHGTGFVATGEDGVRHYASMPFGPDDSSLARSQARRWADPKKRVDVARRMYAWRFGEVLPVTDIAALRGIEGVRVKETYALQARQHGITWRGRHYDRGDPSKNDVPNNALNHAASAVEAAAAVAVAVCGALPQLGFIHEDSGMSFVLDVADLLRAEVTIPVAFAAARQAMQDGEDVERATRRLAGKTMRDRKVIPGMIDRIKELFDGDDGGGDAGRA